MKDVFSKYNIQGVIMMKFINSYRKTITYILILLIVISCVYTYISNEKTRIFFEYASDILVLPSFLITLLVLNILNVTPISLERYYKSKKLNDNATEIIESEFMDYLNENKSTIRNTVDKLENYIDKKISGDELNATLVNDCKNKYNDLKKYYDKTKQCVQNETLDIVNKKDGLSASDNTDYSNLKMSKKDLDKLGDSLDKLSEGFFTHGQLNPVKLEILKKVFHRKNGLFQKYYSISKVTFKNLGGDTNE